MRPGGGKSKGAKFERYICKELSLWLTGGRREDCFWRSAMSGGRATFQHRKGVDIRQCGDITAVSAEGHTFLDPWFIECKHVADLHFDSFLLHNTGKLAQFWKKCLLEAKRHDRKPMIIALQNQWAQPIVLTRHNHLAHIAPSYLEAEHFDITFFKVWMARRARPRIQRPASKR